MLGISALALVLGLGGEAFSYLIKDGLTKDGTVVVATEGAVTETLDPKPLALLQLCSKERVKTIDLVVRANDTFYTMMKGLQIPPREIVEMSERAGAVYDLTRLKQGDILNVTMLDNKVERVEYRFAELKGLVIGRAVMQGGVKAGGLEDTESLESPGSGGETTGPALRGATFLAKGFEVPHIVVKKLVSGTVETSLYEAGIAAGAEPSVVMEITDIFAWDVDFATEIRSGAAFRVLYEELRVDGARPRARRILGAELQNAGRTHTAIYYKDDSGKGGYYDIEGRTLRRTLLRSPLRYRRISSYFSKKRFHPILKRYKAHHGIDYAAPTGTPVEAAGDGRIIFAGWKRGYGKYIVVRHNSSYTTAYGHLSRIKKGIKKGARVSQGAVIGLVGSTGISTGPHLHYEVRIRGRVVNPLGIKPTPRKKLKAEELEAYLASAEAVIARINIEEQVKEQVEMRVEEHVGPKEFALREEEGPKE